MAVNAQLLLPLLLHGNPMLRAAPCSRTPRALTSRYEHQADLDGMHDDDVDRHTPRSLWSTTIIATTCSVTIAAIL